MKMRVLRLIGAAALTAILGARQSRLSAQGLAQTGAARAAVAEGQPLSLDGAIDEALGNNLDLFALRQQAAVVRERPAEEHGLAPPMVEGTIWQWPVNTANPLDTNMYMFMVGQDIPGRGKRDLRAATAQKDAAIAASDVAVRTRDIINQVKQQYAALYVAREASELDAANVDVLTELADTAQARYAAGQLSQQEVLKAVLELSKIHTQRLMFDEQSDVAAARLNVLLNRPPGTPIGPLAEPADLSIIGSSSAELQRLAIDRHPELQRARLEVERAQAELATARGDYKPDFTVQAGYLLMPQQTDALLARVGITWPSAPWSKPRLDAHVGEATAAVEAARAREQAMENAVRLAVQEAYIHAGAAQARAALLRTSILPEAKQTFEAARVSYAADKLPFRDVLDSERATLDAQLDYIRARSEFEQAIADLERAVGTSLPVGTLAPAPGAERSPR